MGWFTKSQDTSDAAYPHTPDIQKLEEFEHMLFFDYGHFLPKDHHISTAYTVERLSVWYNIHNNSQLPIALKSGLYGLQQTPRAKVCGQLYLVDTERLVTLDNERRNGISFTRKRVKLLIPYQDKYYNQCEIRAWTYIGHPEFWNAETDWERQFYRSRSGRSFNPAKTFRDHNRPWLDTYYKFSRLPEEPITQKTYMHLHKGLNDPSITLSVKTD